MTFFLGDCVEVGVLSIIWSVLAAEGVWEDIKGKRGSGAEKKIPGLSWQRTVEVLVMVSCGNCKVLRRHHTKPMKRGIHM